MSAAPPAAAVGEFWTMERVAHALGTGPNDTRPIRAICTDTRQVKPGDLFVALKGENFDAHDFLRDAVGKGAAAVVVRDAKRAAGLGVPVYVVTDTVRALGLLGRYRRRAWGRPVIAVGGSNGKTSTKELIRAALGARLTVHATQGNLNNQIGVPLTLLSLPDNAHIAVIEVGTNTPGEIALLRAIVEPNIAVVTAVQEEHLEGFGDLAGVLREETALLNGAPTAVVPADDQTLTAEARRRAERTVTAGLEAGDIRSSAHGLEPDGSGWLEFDGARITVPLRGEHNLRNTILALAVARECGVSAAAAGAAFASIDLAALPQMRSDISALGAGLLINDAYNSNPGSARAALALLNTVGAGRQRVAIFGTMRELGTQSSRAHRELARAVLDSDTELIAGIGEFGTALNALAGEEGRDDRVITASDVEELWPALAPRMAPGAAILLKASRGVRLERILPHLSTWADGQGL